MPLSGQPSLLFLAAGAMPEVGYQAGSLLWAGEPAFPGVTSHGRYPQSFAYLACEVPDVVKLTTSKCQQEET